ncbi:uncharacterized oxidoreductase YjmC-like [Atheta coriaria]|uniref:uncharacterized oxidoreductase YjmC-like n=1 Tax=Dalotia coriaria TaxID=877792 RepID=UPI0031F4547B
MAGAMRSITRCVFTCKLSGRKHSACLASCSGIKWPQATGERHLATKYGLLDTGTDIIPLADAKRFMTDCMMAVGSPREHAEALAVLLAEADYRGHYSHGMNRLDMYVSDIQYGNCDPKAKPSILKESPATAWVHGNNGIGAVVGNFCMALAIKKAKEAGVGWVACKGSNHYGIAGMYTMQAMASGLLGMSFTNSSPFLTPTRSKQASLGTNPISLAAPSKGDPFVLDMATTAVAVGKIEMERRKGNPIPRGWALGPTGQVETDAEVAFKTGRLMPLGGEECNSGYKGYGLGMLVEIFCGVLGGANFGRNIRKWGSQDSLANLGHCFVAVNPECFAPGFTGRMEELIDMMRQSEQVDADSPVLIAGDPERAHMKAVDDHGGVRYVKDQMATCAKLAKELNVKPLQSL